MNGSCQAGATPPTGWAMAAWPMYGGVDGAGPVFSIGVAAWEAAGAIAIASAASARAARASRAMEATLYGSEPVLHRHERVALDASLHRLLENGPDVADVVLVVEHAGLERGPLLGQQCAARRRAPRPHAHREALHAVVILGLALEVLLPASLADVRVCGHVDPGLSPAHARLPRARRILHPPVRIQLRGL